MGIPSFAGRRPAGGPRHGHADPPPVSRVDAPRSRAARSAVRGRAATWLLAATFAAGWSLLPALAPPTLAAAPAPTLSRYMRSAGLQTHWNLGCNRAKKKVAGPIALLYGKPVLVNGVHGASLYEGPDATIGQIREAAKQFVQGYRDCAINAPLVTLIIATTNFPSDPERVTNAHGQAWANMVDDVAAWTIGKGFQQLVNVHGGSDIEPSWNGVADSRAWVDGYDVAGDRLMYNIGSSDGCPQAGDGKVNGACNNGWRQSDLLYVSWVVPSGWPIPQIYTNNSSQAKQWRYIKLYGVVTAGRIMSIQGSLTQRAACLEVGCPIDTDNTPAQGWQQLFDQLNADNRTAQALKWSTDISWEQ